MRPEGWAIIAAFVSGVLLAESFREARVRAIVLGWAK